MEESNNVLFMKKHKKGVVLASCSAVLTAVCSNIFDVFRASFEASIATNQVNDSIIQYSLIHELITSNTCGGIILAVGAIAVVGFLFPAIKDMIKVCRS